VGGYGGCTKIDVTVIKTGTRGSIFVFLLKEVLKLLFLA
jgi:hypothetical protein